MPRLPDSFLAVIRPLPSWRSFFPGALGLVAFVAALAAFSTWQSRLHYERQVQVSADNLSQVLGNHINSSTEKIDLILKATARKILQQKAKGGIDVDALQFDLAQHKLLLPDVGDLLVADCVFRSKPPRILMKTLPAILAETWPPIPMQTRPLIPIEARHVGGYVSRHSFKWWPVSTRPEIYNVTD